jgi:hypothetical protein
LWPFFRFFQTLNPFWLRGGCSSGAEFVNTPGPPSRLFEHTNSNKMQRLQASVSGKLPAWLLYHCPLALRAWLHPQVKVYQLVHQNAVLGYVTVPTESAESGPWQGGSLYPLHTLSPEPTASRIMFEALIASNSTKVD